MGWRQGALAQESVGGGRVDAKARAFTPSGVLGIDMAGYQGKVNWRSWANKGRKFAYVKATEGSTYRNPYFKAQYAGAAKAGLIRSAYHFANPAGKSGKTQARYFVKIGGGWSADGKTLPGVLDIEYKPVRRNVLRHEDCREAAGGVVGGHLLAVDVIATRPNRFSASYSRLAVLATKAS